MIKERPILFSGPMILALLSGVKTQTRRIVKPQTITPSLLTNGAWIDAAIGKPVRCKYGSVGDALWVRESFRQAYPKTSYSAGLVYRADAPKACGMDEYSDRHRWKPSIHMPRWASRITLEIISVRVERLQSISGSDAANEGVHVPCDERGRPLLRLTGKVPPSKFSGKHAQDWTADDYYRFEYAELWESINGPGSWDANPFVWVIEFRKT